MPTPAAHGFESFVWIGEPLEAHCLAVADGPRSRPRVVGCILPEDLGRATRRRAPARLRLDDEDFDLAPSREICWNETFLSYESF
jgi:hypothetical protein